MEPTLLFLPLILEILASLSCAQLAGVDELVKRQAFPGCGPGLACSPPAVCVAGGCACAPAPVYSPPAVGCAPPASFAPLPPPPPPPAGRLIPQALPGAPCEPGVECTGGSVCSMGICLCPPELVQEGTVCVSRTIYGVVPPVPPPMPPPVPAFAPPPMPYPVPAPILPAYAPPPMMAAPACGCPFCEGCRGCGGPAFAAPCIRRRESQGQQQFDDVPDSTEMGE